MTDRVSSGATVLGTRAVMGVVWGISVAVVLGALLAMPSFSQAHFWNWSGSQEVVVDRLAEDGLWQAALSRVDAMIERRPWDPRPLHRRAELLRDRLVGRRYDTAADSEVAEAFGAACHAYFKMAHYPALLSPSTRRRMADSYFQWGVCASRRADWALLGFCMEYAADLDPLKVEEILQQTIQGTTELAQMPAEVLRSGFQILQRHRSAEDALEFLMSCRGLLPEDEWLTLALQGTVARDRRKSRDEIIRAQSESQAWQEILHAGLLGRGMSARIAYLPFYEMLNAGRSVRRGPLDWVQLGRFREVLGDATMETTSDLPRGENVEGWMMFTDQEMRFSWETDPPETESLCLMVRGTEALDVWPVIEVQVNGGDSRFHLLHGDQLLGLDLAIPGGQLDSLTVRYHNDGGFIRLSPEGDLLETLQDRNVQIFGAWIHTGVQG